jgi:pimeloyl-ACP methyl ester carboxylesterase
LRTVTQSSPPRRLVLGNRVGRADLSAYSREKYGSLQGYADDVVEICSELELSDVIFVGHSVSSMIGILAATKAPGLFQSLILVGPLSSGTGYFAPSRAFAPRRHQHGSHGIPIDMSRIFNTAAAADPPRVRVLTYPRRYAPILQGDLKSANTRAVRNLSENEK